MEYEIVKTCLTIFVPPELDHHVAEHIRVQADKLIEVKNIKRVVFDFTRTKFMDSSGIGVIMGRYKLIRLIGGTVEADHVSPGILRLLQLSGLHKIIKIHEDVPSAVWE